MCAHAPLRQPLRQSEGAFLLCGFALALVEAQLRNRVVGIDTFLPQQVQIISSQVAARTAAEAWRAATRIGSHTGENGGA